MDPCAGQAVCPPVTAGWSMIILWTITAYGVLAFLSLFAACVHLQSPSSFGKKLLRYFAIGNGVGLVIAPLLLVGLFESPRAAAVVMLAELALALICRASSKRSPSEPPVARALS